MNAMLTNSRREAYEERAAILEFDAGMSREEAERMAAEMVIPDRVYRAPMQPHQGAPASRAGSL